MGNLGFTLACYRHVLFVFPIIRCIPRFILYFFQNLICPSMFCLWFLLCQPIRLINQEVFNTMFEYIFDGCLAIVSSWLDLAGHTIYECGDDISHLTHDEALVIVNHQSPNDIGTIMRVFQDKDNLFCRVMWIMDYLMQFFHFGWVSKLHGDFFLLQTNDAVRLSKIFPLDVEKSNQQQPIKLCKNLLYNFEQRNKQWIVLFPEGGFLRKRRSGSQRYARKNGFPVLQHVALPRTRAFFEVVHTLGLSPSYKEQNNSQALPNLSNHVLPQNAGESPHYLNGLIKNRQLKWIVDTTIGYDEPFGIAAFMFGCFGVRNVIVHYKCIPAYDILKSKSFASEEEMRDHVRDWLYGRWVEKEKLLTYFYKYNNFPVSKDTPENCTLRFPRMNFFSAILTQIAAFFTVYCLIYLWTYLTCEKLH